VSNGASGFYTAKLPKAPVSVMVNSSPPARVAIEPRDDTMPRRRCPESSPARQPVKVALLHMDVRMLRAQDAQEQPFAGGNEATV
jgi:hypothetical protein